MFGIQGRIFTIPNIISLSRGVLIIPAIYLLMRGTAVSVIIAAVLGVVIVLSDILDGVIARKINAVSEWGKIIDPLVDKFCVLVAIISAAAWREFPVYAAVIIVGRDVLIILTATILFRKRKIPEVSHPIGKYTAFITAVTLLLYLFQAGQVKEYFLVLTLIMIPVSGLFYLFRSIVVFKSNKDSLVGRQQK